MANEQTKAVMELVLIQIQYLETVGVPENHEQLKNLKGWVINQKLDELGGKTILEVAR
jgi:hypothetical protein